MNRNLLALYSLSCLFGAAFARPVCAGDNYAFLVAVGDYDIKQLKPLNYTRNDIFDFHQVLLDSGYKAENVVLMHDDLSKLKNRRYLPEAEKIRQELGLLLAGLDKGDSVVVAFSGHGVEFQGEDKNYFCPADTDWPTARSWCHWARSTTNSRRVRPSANCCWLMPAGTIRSRRSARDGPRSNWKA